MSQEIALFKKAELVQNLDDLMSLANVLVKSGLLPTTVNTPEKAAAIILKGRELGMPVMESMALINVIQGKPTIAPQGMLALAYRTGQLEELDIKDDGFTCTVTMTRKGRKPHSESFSMDDAANLGLAVKDNWKKQPKTMRKWRAIAACARVVFPDVIGGMYTPEEMGANVAITDDGDVVWEDDKAVEILNRKDDFDQRPANDAVEAEATQVEPEQPVQRTDGVLEYQIVQEDQGEVLYVKVGNDWKVADASVGPLNDKSRAKIAALFKNDYEMTNHLKKHFAKATPAALTWEELAALFAWKRDGKASPKFYQDKIEVKHDARAETAKMYGLTGELSKEQAQFVDSLMLLSSPLVLLNVIKTRGWTMEQNLEDLTNLAVLLANGTLEFNTADFWTVVDSVLAPEVESE